MSRNLNEDTLTEQPVIEWLKELGYDYELGPDLAPGQVTAERENFREVLLLPRLKRSLIRINPFLNDSSTEEIIEQLTFIEHPNLEEENRQMYRLLTDGAKYDLEENTLLVRFFDFENPQNNEFLVVNQLAVQGPDSVRRPDVVVYVNGIPLAVFELKSPTSESGTIRSAYLQLEGYKKDIAQLFKYNHLLVISDLVKARYGTVSSAWDRFAIWKGLESENDD